VLAAGKPGLVGQIFEVGPRLTFSTAYSSNAVGPASPEGLNRMILVSESPCV
jgi:hypothetical protein